MHRTLIKQATVLPFTPLADGSLDLNPRSLDVLIEGDRIAQIAPTIEAEAEIIDARDHLLIPGFVDAHTHSTGVLEKASYEALPLEIWMLYVSPPTWQKPLNPRIHYLCAAVAAIEAAKHGTTTIQDDLYVSPHNTPAVFDAVAQAYTDVGIRSSISYSAINKPLYETIPYLSELLPDQIKQILTSGPQLSDDEWVTMFKDLYQAWHNKNGLVRIILSPNAPQRVSSDLLERIAELSQDYDLPINSHMLESRTQAVTGPEFYGESIIAYAKRHGILTHRTTVAHGVWLDPHDVELIAAAGATVSHNIVSNHRLCSGIAAVKNLMDAGVNIALGSDGMETFNLFHVLKATGLVHSLTDTDYQTYPKAADVLKWATLGGAKSTLMHQEIGAVAEGMKADLVLYDLNTISFTPRYQLPIHLVYSEQGESIRKVMINGKLIVNDGKLLTMDERAILAELRDYMPEYLEYRELCHQQSNLIRPYMDRVFQTAIAKPLSVHRFSSIS
jgi:cytosine/adenosine deaminase-related metal-dependent hydrolase